jgi:hypothetical protein
MRSNTFVIAFGSPFSRTCVACNVPDIQQRGGSTAVDRTVARLNIEHFRELLAHKTGEHKRQTLLQLLAEEEAKLASLTKPLQNRKSGG